MKASDFISQNLRDNGSNIYVGPIIQHGPFCKICWQQDAELNAARHDLKKRAWVCERGHEVSDPGVLRSVTALAHRQ
jgi:hypothetical protein